MKILKFMAAALICAAFTGAAAAEIDINGTFKRNAKGGLINWNSSSGLVLTSLKNASGVEIKVSPKATWGGLYGKRIPLKKDEKLIMTVSASGKGYMGFGATWYNKKGSWYRNEQKSGKLTEKTQIFKAEFSIGNPKMPDAASFSPTVLLNKNGTNIAKINFIKVEVVKK